MYKYLKMKKSRVNLIDSRNAWKNYRNDGFEALASYKLCSFCNYPSFVSYLTCREHGGREETKLTDLLTDSF